MNPTQLSRQQGGFSMALVMAVLLLTSSLGIAAFAAARGGINASAASKDRKQAFAAAEAGINWYQARLASDNTYWTKCTAVPDVATGVPAPVNQIWSGSGADPRRWRNVPGTTASYAIEMLPAPGNATCNSAAADGSAGMIDARGTFRIRSTGRFNGEKRSIVTHFRRARFLDFLWFTDYETTDPLAYPDYTFPDTSPPYTYRQYAYDNCADRYRTARDSAPSDLCREITFAAYDKLLGPVHSNDSMLICGGATFGRPGTTDRIESAQIEDTAVTGSPSPGWRPSCGSTSPSFATPFRSGQQTVQMPATSTSLAGYALPGYTFTGETKFVLRADGLMDVTRSDGSVTSGMAWPANGFIYVGSGAGCTLQPPVSMQYTEGTGCANAVVKGVYPKDITIASQKDVVVNGSLTRSGDVLAGLIADNFVRVYHPVTSGCANTSGPYGPFFSSVTVEAAILSLQHSFTADNYDCGPALGALTIKGAIAQKYRGAVATGTSGGGATPSTGFVKDYNYDERLKYRNPPYFLDPVNAAWKTLRQTEQIPAR